jgi:pyruvate dehydrogenase E2 component (dihydrolipoamide acetyltransferase)
MEKKRDKKGRVILQEIPYTGIRKIIGQRMRQSLDTAPQGTVITRADMTYIVKLKEELQEKNVRVSYTDIFIKLLACALKEIPILNATRNDEVITIFETVNVGIAVKAGSALVVPVVFDVQNKNVIEIAKETKDLIANVRGGKLELVPMEGGTITINNLGMFDVDGCTPFVNLPEASILAIGTIRKDVWVEEDNNIAVKPVTTLSLTIDHSITDGAPAAQFLGIIKGMMKKPEIYVL